MALLIPAQVQIAGTQITKTAADPAGETFAPGNVKLIVDNGSAGAVVVTVVVPGDTKYGLDNPDLTRSIPAGQEFVFGPFGDDLADPADGRVHITYDVTTSVTRALLRG